MVRQLLKEDLDISDAVGDLLLANKQNNDMDENFDLGKSLWLRFLRGAIAGAVSTGGTITFIGGHTFSDLKSFVATLSVALIVGAITGGLLAIDKFVRV